MTLCLKNWKIISFTETSGATFFIKKSQGNIKIYIIGRSGLFSSFLKQLAVVVNDFFTENIFTDFSAREVPSSARVRFGNPLVLELEYILYFGEISVGNTWIQLL